MSVLNVDWYHPNHLKDPEVVFVLLHGFPGRRTRNEDLLLKLVVHYGVAGVLYRYKGLGANKGEFTFFSAIEDTIQTLEFVSTQGYKKIILLGHSFGGFVTLNVIQRIPQLIKGVFLLAPLIFMPEHEVVESMIDDFCYLQNGLKEYSANKELLTEQANELKVWATQENYREKLKSLPFSLPIVHPFQDEVVPYKSSEIFQQLLPETALLHGVDDNHWLVNREVLMPYIYDVAESEWGLVGAE